MNSDNSSGFGGCPKAKKSKTERHVPVPHWAHLPSVVIREVFDLLGKADRQNASSVCRNWRQHLYHPKWWPKVTFKIEPCNIARARFFTFRFGTIVSRAEIQVNTLGPQCTDDFIALLEALTQNNNLKELIIEPTHCHFDMLTHNNSKYNTSNVITTLKQVLPNLLKFSIGCIEDFAHYLDEYLKILALNQSNKITLLGLASVKDNPNEYLFSYFESSLLKSFTNLKVLSIDFDQISDVFLQCLDNSKDLERLIVHVHGVRDGHPGTTNAAWAEFKNKHPKCELRLTVIHSYEEIGFIHETVLNDQMPLTHIKVFFCENVNMRMLELLPVYYANSLRSVIWVDSISPRKRSWSFLTSPYDNNPDPLIILAWLCKKLEELVFYGYKYCEDNLKAIARLRGDKLKKFEMAEDDILSLNGDDQHNEEHFLVDIPLQLKKPWAPTKTEDLHPVIRDPTAGDSDEYLLPIVLADLH